ncbi:pentatricopeptide repeat-containing protein At5g65570 isoform X2 [Abrus precatorius]|uniref:Pentatricopeptide repeat-containing protein At5g65570 isoform X2 n=1 Tax=Abrus precatorius TaxID=3816 RepID=A0A8B8LZF2_ABRPR|nr:pentatricopeptide repeat-containing protein At5g65570 isoform X2 [Abrus precatorius]XP_027361761.1 pentatricopeptide repeat-containing protein At5g65570 isoform X2 [Abrus precatorius]
MNFYSSLIAQCAHTKSLTALRAVHANVIKSGFSYSLLGHKLIDVYIKCCSLAEARNLFDELPNRHIVTWNSMISSHVSHGKSKEAVEFYGNMLVEGVLPDAYTFSAIFKAFSELDLLCYGQKAHGLAVILGLEVLDGFVASALVDMYAKFDKMKDAHLVFDRVLEKDVVLFTALIVGYAQHGLDREALGVFEDMVNRGVKPNEYTLASVLISCGNLGGLVNGQLIHGLVVKSGLESVVASQTSLLTMYSRCSMVEDSIRVFNQLDYASQVTWTSFVVGLVQNGREEVAVSIFREMIRCSISPNPFTLSSILHACSSLAMLEVGEQIHSIIKKLGLNGNKYAGAALINLYGKCGNIGKARSVFDELSELDVVSINSMIYAYAQNGFGHGALQLFERMKKLGFAPNSVTFISILLACNNAGLVEEGCQIFASIRNNHNIGLTRDHFACMIDLLGRARRLEEAAMLIEEVRNPDVVLWRILLNACKIHGEVEMAEKIMRKILELAPGDGGTHILLTNLYASAGKWSQVIEMKSTIRDLKLKKSPAMSWVDVDREVHTFMAGDLSHPRAHEILEMLLGLIEKVKTLGYNPDTRFVLQDLDEEKKMSSLHYHSEKLAIAFALWKTIEMQRDSIISKEGYVPVKIIGKSHLLSSILSPSRCATQTHVCLN